jgi:hypothetical protein
MSRYIPPSKRKEEVVIFDSNTLSNETLFPALSSPTKSKTNMGGFKEVIEERLRKEAEDAIRATQPLDLWSMTVLEREAHGYVTLKVRGNTNKELAAIVARMHLRTYEAPDW